MSKVKRTEMEVADSKRMLEIYSEEAAVRYPCSGLK